MKQWLQFLVLGLVGWITQMSQAAPVVKTSNGLAVWYDVRDNTSPGQDILISPSVPWTNGTSVFVNKKSTTFFYDVVAGNDGGPGDGEILFISPHLPIIPPATLGLHWTEVKKKASSIMRSRIYTCI